MKSLDEWRSSHQVFELNFHRGRGGDWRYDERWQTARDALGDRHQLDWSAFRGKRVVDVGSGPRSMLEWFDDAELHCVEPLANEYQRLAKCRLNHERIKSIYAQPGEELVKELVGTASLVWTHNCLDHCYDWRRVISNMAEYMSPDGRFYISTDAGRSPKTGHPGIASTDELVQAVEAAGLRITYRWNRIPNRDPIWVRDVTLMGISVNSGDSTSQMAWP